MTRRVLVFLALFSAVPAWAKVNSTDLRQWLPELPPFTRAAKSSRSQHLAEWIQHVRIGMSVSQVLVMLGHPDWGVSTRGRLRWAGSPKEGVLVYSSGGSDSKGGSGIVIELHFDNEARVKRIVQNGVLTEKAPRLILPGPLPRGVWWRR